MCSDFQPVKVTRPYFWGITKDVYTKKQQEYESKIYELNLQLTQETKETTDLHLTVSSLFNLINRLPEIFKSSNSTEKNQILKYLISNSLQTGQKAEFNLKKPFLFLYQNQSNQHWFTVVDSLRTYDWSDFEITFGQILSTGHFEFNEVTA